MMAGAKSINKLLGMHATAKTAQGEKHREGRVIGYSNAPMVCIRDAAGNNFWWRADLCEYEEPPLAKEEKSAP